jgi:hypothetical protein
MARAAVPENCLPWGRMISVTSKSDDYEELTRSLVERLAAAQGITTQQLHAM